VTAGSWDESWAPVAAGSREALRQLGYDIGPACLPGEPESCGATYAEHAAAQLSAVIAVAEHHLAHMGLLAQMKEDVVARVSARLAETCCAGHGGAGGMP